MALTKDQILSVNDLVVVEFSVPEWGDTVYLRPLTGNERDAFESYVMHTKDGRQPLTMRARLAALSICDETGKRLFTDAEIRTLGGKSSKPLNRIFAKVQELNGFSDEAVKELEGNSDGTTADDSGSDSPHISE